MNSSAKIFLTGLIVLPSCILSGCKDDDGPDSLPPYKIVIRDIVGIPSDVTFDRIVVEIKGACFDVIASVEAPYVSDTVALEVPSNFYPEELQTAMYVNKVDPCGYWRGTVSDPEALVASLGDLLAYNGDTKVGRVYLTDWPGTGSSGGKAFIYYHYTDRPFQVTGITSNNSFNYNTSFEMGWNVYANVNPPETPGGGRAPISVTTTIPNETRLRWRFEKH